MLEPLTLVIEDFAQLHPSLNPELLIEHARVALAKYHVSPASFRIECGDEVVSATVQFELPDPRSLATLEREDFVEKGAIVLAGLLLAVLEKKQITAVVPRRGGRIDYFVGEEPGDMGCILEVSGTDEGSFSSRRQTKHEQLSDSFYHQAPFSKNGFVAVTRFAPPAVSCLDFVPAPQKGDKDGSQV